MTQGITLTLVDGAQRGLRRAPVTIAALTALPTCGARQNAADSTGSASAPPPGVSKQAPPKVAGPTDFEPDDTVRCLFDDAAGARRCSGYVPVGWKSGWGDQSKDMADWIQNDALYDTPSKFTNRSKDPNDPSPAPKFRIAKLKDARSVALSKLGDRPLVVAEILADPDPGAAADTRYGIDRRKLPLGPKLFLVVQPFTFDQTGKPPGNGAVQHQVSTWHLYGVNTHNGTLMHLNSGKYFRCDHEHTTQEQATGARFMTCVGMQELATWTSMQPIADAFNAQSAGRAAAASARSPIEELLDWAERGPVDETSLRTRLTSLLGQNLSPDSVASFAKDLAKIFTDLPNDPGWMMCGLGCCVADNNS